MKTTTTLPSAVLKFPLLAKHNSTGCIVLMRDATNGTILQGLMDFPVGDYVMWAYKVTDELHWTILPEGTTVTLTQ